MIVGIQYSPAMVHRRRRVPGHESQVLRISDENYFESHGAAVLLLIRDKGATNWPRLCRRLKFDPAGNHSGHFALRQTVRGLMEAGFLERTTDRGPYRITELLERVQTGLDLSLVEASILRPHDGMAVEPRFGPRPEDAEGAHVFVLMPFANEFAPVYEAISIACRGLRLSVARADDLSSTRDVMSDIWAGICNAGAIVADCSGRNPNVFYEIGVAHTVGRAVVLLSQDLSELPFDIGHLRHIEYKNTPAGLAGLRKRLAETIKGVRASGWASW